MLSTTDSSRLLNMKRSLKICLITKHNGSRLVPLSRSLSARLLSFEKRNKVTGDSDEVYVLRNSS